jgi:hypothetical protein
VTISRCPHIVMEEYPVPYLLDCLQNDVLFSRHGVSLLFT